MMDPGAADAVRAAQSPNAYWPMVRIESGSETDVSEVLLRKAYSPIFCTPLLTVSVFSPLHQPNALLPTVLSADGSVTLCSDSQNSNALSPMVFTPAGRLIVESFLQL